MLIGTNAKLCHSTSVIFNSLQSFVSRSTPIILVQPTIQYGTLEAMPYRLPSPPTVPVVPFATRAKNWLSKVPERHPLVIVLLYILTLSSTCVMSLSIMAPPVNARQAMTANAQRWAGYHHGRLFNCEPSPDGRNYSCRVSTSAGYVRLVYDFDGNYEPYMVLPDQP